MQIDMLKQLVQEMELADAFDGIEAESCQNCCGVGNSGNPGC